MSKKTLVLGASENPSRYSNIALKKLHAANHKVIAIGNRIGNVDGIEISTNLVAIEGVDTITLYLSPKNQKEYYDYIVSLQPKRVLFNPGTENLELQEILTKHKISFENACTLVLLSIDNY